MFCVACQFVSVIVMVMVDFCAKKSFAFLQASFDFNPTGTGSELTATTQLRIPGIPD